MPYATTIGVSIGARPLRGDRLQGGANTKAKAALVSVHLDCGRSRLHTSHIGFFNVSHCPPHFAYVPAHAHVAAKAAKAAKAGTPEIDCASDAHPCDDLRGGRGSPLWRCDW